MALFTLLTVSLIVFSLMELVPGNCAERYLAFKNTQGSGISIADIQAEERRLGLDKPFLVRWGSWVGNVFLKGEFGDSCILRVDINQLLGDKFLISAAICLVSLALAYLIESLMLVYMPAEAVARTLGGDGLTPILLSALVGAPAYLNSYAAPPLVAGLMEQGMGAGPAMAFMIAGGVSCIPAMTAVFALVRRAVFAAYVVLGFSGAVLAGVIFGTLVDFAII